MKVAILTMFSGLATTYSLVNVVADQIKMLLEAGIDLLNADVLAVYPARLTPGKRLEKVAALAGAIQRKTEQRTKVIFCDFPSADIPGEVYKRNIRTEGQKFGLEKGDLVLRQTLDMSRGFRGRACSNCSDCQTCFSVLLTRNPSA